MPKVKKITDEQLQDCLHQGMTAQEIAVEYNMAVRNVQIRKAKLAAKDAYASRGGWMSWRSANVITYSSEYGEVGRLTISPEMLK
ncbi:TPA: hypothetical protein I9675_004527 [Salmonella enterica subsp. enterica serovar Typhimurium]|nr:hypothetical protein [Salmonella enterica subsp. enterica serovar Typhimurium]